MYKTEGEKIVDAFYREYLKGSVYKAGMWMLVGVAICLEFIAVALPFSAMMEAIKEDDVLLFGILLSCSIWAVYLYLCPYRMYVGQGKKIPLEEHLKYIPINKVDLYRVQVKKIVVFLARITVVATLLQLLTSAIAKTLSVWCIVYVFVVAFCIPFLVMAILIGIEFCYKQK